MRTWWWCAIFAAGALTVSADWVVLKNGQKLRGEIERGADDPIVLAMPSMTARIDRADVAEVILEAQEVYFVEATRAYVEEGVLKDAARLAERGRGACRDALAPIEVAIEALLAARNAEAALDFATALVRTRAAREAFGPSARLDRELVRLEQARGFFDAKQCLPGPFLELARAPITILHHHPRNAVTWWELAAAELVRTVPTMRRSVHHKLPEDVLFVIEVYRDRDEFLAATKDLVPHGLLPESDQGRLITRARGATYAEVAATHIPALMARLAAISLFEYAPLWLTEGLAGGGAAASDEAASREAAAQLATAGPLPTLAVLMKTSHYGDLDFVGRARLHATCRCFVRYIAGSRDGLAKVSRAIDNARNAMLADLLNPGKKHFKLKSYRIEDLVRGYLPHFVPKELGFDDLAAMEQDFAAWIKTGKRKGK